MGHRVEDLPFVAVQNPRRNISIVYQVPVVILGR